MPRRELIPLILALWLTAASGVAASWGTPAHTRVTLAATAAALGGTGIALLIAARAKRRLRRVSAMARRLLADAPDSTPAPNTDTDEPGEPIDPERDADLAAIAGSLRQLGRRMAAQVKDLAKKSRNLEALIDGLDEPLLVTDDEDQVLINNRAAEAMLDAPVGTLTGKPIRALFTSLELLDMHAAARAGRTLHGRLPIVSPAGTRVFQASAAPLPAAWGKGVFGVVLVLRDVTELAQAVQLKTDFVANASHELRTPVTAIRVAVETLLDGAKDDPAMLDRMLRVTENHARRLEDMVRDLMDLSRLESPDVRLRIEPLDLDDTRATLAQIFEPALAQRRLRLEFDLNLPNPAAPHSTDTPPQTDGRVLMMILRNLVDNAAKYAHEQTTIHVRCRPIDAPTSPASRADPANPHAPTRWARFEVADQGPGIPLAQQERVFERFYQIDPARTGSSKRGTGLGLSIVKNAARALGGHVGIDSVWGQGTTVWVELPV